MDKSVYGRPSRQPALRGNWSRSSLNQSTDRASSKPSASSSPSPSSPSSPMRDRAFRSLRFVLPILALYTLFSLGWTRPIAAPPVAVDLAQPQANLAAAGDVSLAKPTAARDSQPARPAPAAPAVAVAAPANTNANGKDKAIPDRAPRVTRVAESGSKEMPVQAVEAVAPPANVAPPVSKATSSGSGEGEQMHRPTSHRLKMMKRNRPACSVGTGRAKTFLMVFMGHSGSSAIMTELKDHPEMFVRQLEPVDHKDFEKNTTMALEYTRNFFDEGIKQGKLPGFKIRPNHIRRDPKAWAALAREYDTRIIWQYRRQTLKQAVGEYSYRYYKDTSILEGLKTEEEVKSRCETGAGCSFKIEDMFFFHQLLTHIVRSDYLIAESAETIADGRDCIHELRYEDYLYHREGSMKDLNEFLGVSYVQTQPARFKATRDNLCDVVENWEELCHNFYGCAVWRRFFEDEINACGCRFSSSPWRYCNLSLVDNVVNV